MSSTEQALSPRASSIPREARTVLKMLDGLSGGSLELRLPDGERASVGQGPLVAHVEVLDWSVFGTLISKGSIGFGEDYINGLWRCDHLAALLTLATRSRASLTQAIHGDALRLVFYKLWHALRANTRNGARRNIEAHYDLGNDFYALWLDETMTYSSALFGDAETDLPTAQRAKYRRILDQLDARPGQQILEIGCGWGGFAEVAATEYGCRVHGVTLSPAQLAYARQRATRCGYADRVLFELCDYRDLSGQFDHIVSIEMIEAVGERYWGGYFTQLRERLVPGGRCVVQAITIDPSLFGFYRRNPDFIQRYVFPGGMLPSPERVREEAQRAGLAVKGEFAFGRHYADTLALWHSRFNARLDAVRAQGFDDRFMRLWQFYLAYCEAGFRAGSTDVWHFEFAHA